jgi:hypothetical protein
MYLRAIGSWGPFAALVADVVVEWPMSRLRPATAALLEADMALKNTTVSDDEGVLTDLVLTLATQRVRKAA